VSADSTYRGRFLLWPPLLLKDKIVEIWGLYYKNFYGGNLRIFVTS
jgi:hypothetical protein